MTVDEFISMLEMLGYEDESPLTITTSRPLTTSFTFGDFKAQWNAGRIW